MRASLASPASLLLLLAAALVLAACGVDSENSNGSGTDAAASIEHLHVDGTLAATDDEIVVTAADGEEYTFTYGPEVERAEVLAMAAAGAEARVTFRPREGTPVAAEVGEKPDKEGLSTFEGQVVSIDSKELVVEGEGGERTFSIAGTDHAAFDPDHLEEHRERKEPIVVYFDPKAPDVGIAYEDA